MENWIKTHPFYAVGDFMLLSALGTHFLPALVLGCLLIMTGTIWSRIRRLIPVNPIVVILAETTLMPMIGIIASAIAHADMTGSIEVTIVLACFTAIAWRLTSNKPGEIV